MMARHHSQPAMLPYRENGVLRYAPAQGILPDPTITHNGDYEALLANTIYDDEEGCDADVTERFTAIGRPMPVLSPNVRADLGLYTAPQHLPVRFTDDSIIPVVVELPDPSGIQ